MYRGIMVLSMMVLLMACGSELAAQEAATTTLEASPQTGLAADPVTSAATPETPAAAAVAARIVEHCLEINGQPTFLKLATPLLDWHGEQDWKLLPTLKDKGYNAVQMSLYWFHFAREQEGQTTYSLGLLPKYLAQARELELQVVLGFGTYSVGGGGDPEFLHQRYGEDQYRAVDINGRRMDQDQEYGFQWPVVSLHNRDFQREAREFMQYILKNIDPSGIVWYETTVEPQYYGAVWLDFSPSAQAAFQNWLSGQYPSVAELNTRWGTELEDFAQVQLPRWEQSANGGNAWLQWWDFQQFRTRELIDWINGDIAAIRDVVPNALVAVDYLLVEWGMEKRLGDAHQFLREVKADIFQCNRQAGWVYSTVRPVVRDKTVGIMEHMTASGDMHLGGMNFKDRPLDHIFKERLVDSLLNGNKVAWSVINTRPSTADAFTLYNDDWSPKDAVGFFDAQTKFLLDTAGHYQQQPLPGPSTVAIVFDHRSAYATQHPQLDPQGDRYTAALQALVGLFREIGKGYLTIDVIPFDKEHLKHHPYWIIVCADVADDETLAWVETHAPTKHHYLRFGTPGQLRPDGTLRPDMEKFWQKYEREYVPGQACPPGLLACSEDKLLDTYRNVSGPQGMIAWAGWVLVDPWASEEVVQYFGDTYFTAPYQRDEYLIYNEELNEIIIGPRIKSGGGQ